MSAPHGDQIVAGYIAQLELALAGVPQSRRNEVVGEIREHISEARAKSAAETDADVYNVLERLGDPADIAAEAGTRVDDSPPARVTGGWADIAAAVLTPVFWPVGVILLWISPAWSVRDKLIGTLVPPGGYIGTYVGMSFALLFGTSVSPGGCSGGGDAAGNTYQSCAGVMALPGFVQVGLAAGGILVFLAWLMLPVLTGIYLGVRLRRSRTSPMARQVVAADSR